MQIILVSRHLKVARTVVIMPRHIMAALFGLAAIVLSAGLLFSWLSVQLRLPLVEELLVKLHLQEVRKTREYLEGNLQSMSARLAELQARVMQLDTLGARISSLAGVKSEHRNAQASAAQGGPFIPAPLTEEALQREIDRLADIVDSRNETMSVLENRLLEQRARARQMPSALPIQGAYLGSPFGHRDDPIAGLRAMHEGIDFNAEVGTPVLAAGDGLVLTAAYHPEFGNMVEIDHGEGLTSRYAHLSEMNVKPGSKVTRGDRLGAVGNTGRSTGPHLHFEVRLLGVARNPANYLKQDKAYALLKRR